MVPPQRMTLDDGQIAISFRDVLYNILVNQIKGVDYREMNEKVKEKTLRVSTSKHPMSHKHRKRLERQMKRLVRS